MKAAVVLPLVVGAWCAVGEGDVERAVKNHLQAVQDVTALLKTVKDKESAEAAAAKLEEPAKRLMTANEALKKLARDHAGSPKIDDKLNQQWTQAGKEFEAEQKRLLKEPALQDILRKSPSWRQLDLQSQDANLALARVTVKVLEKAVQVWNAKYGKWPDSLQDLTKNGPDGGPPFLLEAGLKDPWGRPYHYDATQRHPTTDVPLIWSDGIDPRDPACRIANWTPPAKDDKK
jgi:hypothetical protein